MAFENSNDWKEFLQLESEETPASPFVVKRIVKRDGSIEKYDRWKIASAIGRAVAAVQGMEDKELTERLTEKTEDKPPAMFVAAMKNLAMEHLLWGVFFIVAYPVGKGKGICC